MSSQPVDIEKLSYIISLGENKVDIKQNNELSNNSYDATKENEESILKGFKSVIFSLGTKPSNLILCGSNEIKSYFRDINLGDVNTDTKVICGIKKNGKWKFSGKPHKKFQSKIDDGTIEEWEMSIADIDKYFNLLKSQENKDKEVAAETPVIILKRLSKDLKKLNTELSKLNSNISDTRKELESAEISMKGAEAALVAGGIKSGVPKSLSSSVTRRIDKLNGLDITLKAKEKQISDLEINIVDARIKATLYESRKSVECKDIAT